MGDLLQKRKYPDLPFARSRDSHARNRPGKGAYTGNPGFCATFRRPGRESGTSAIAACRACFPREGSDETVTNRLTAFSDRDHFTLALGIVQISDMSRKRLLSSSPPLPQGKPSQFCLVRSDSTLQGENPHNSCSCPDGMPAQPAQLFPATFFTDFY